MEVLMDQYKSVIWARPVFGLTSRRPFRVAAALMLLLLSLVDAF